MLLWCSLGWRFCGGDVVKIIVVKMIVEGVGRCGVFHGAEVVVVVVIVEA